MKQSLFSSFEYTFIHGASNRVNYKIDQGGLGLFRPDLQKVESRGMNAVRGKFMGWYDFQEGVSHRSC